MALQHLCSLTEILQTSIGTGTDYSLINFNDDEDGEDMKIQLYPSLQFGWDLPQFRAVTQEYLKEETQEEGVQGEIIPEEFEEEEE